MDPGSSSHSELRFTQANLDNKPPKLAGKVTQQNIQQYQNKVPLRSRPLRHPSNNSKIKKLRNIHKLLPVSICKSLSANVQLNIDALKREKDETYRFC